MNTESPNPNLAQRWAERALVLRDNAKQIHDLATSLSGAMKELRLDLLLKEPSPPAAAPIFLGPATEQEAGAERGGGEPQSAVEWVTMEWRGKESWDLCAQGVLLVQGLKFREAEQARITLNAQFTDLRAQLAAAKSDAEEERYETNRTASALQAKEGLLKDVRDQLAAAQAELAKTQVECGAYQMTCDELRAKGAATQVEARELREALERLANAAEAFAADQSKETDERCGVVQPITVAEGKELCWALEQATASLAKHAKEGGR